MSIHKLWLEPKYKEERDEGNYKFAMQFIKENETVADISCGEGYCTRLIAAKGCHVIGIDYSSKAISKARALSKDAKNVSFMQKDLNRDKIGLKDLDVIVSIETIEHIQDPRQLIAQFAECLKQGGELILTTPNGRWPTTETNPEHVSELTYHQLREMLEEHGFKIQKLWGRLKVKQIYRIKDARLIKGVLDRMPKDMRRMLGKVLDSPTPRARELVELAKEEDLDDYKQMLVHAILVNKKTK